MEIDRWRTDFNTSSGFNQFYRDWRPRDEFCLAVLALHGSLTQSGMWIAPTEAASSIRMLCSDQRGFGLSNDPGGDSCALFAADARALARNLFPERYVIMGHSFACSITLEAARPQIVRFLTYDQVRDLLEKLRGGAKVDMLTAKTQDVPGAPQEPASAPPELQGSAPASAPAAAPPAPAKKN